MCAPLFFPVWLHIMNYEKNFTSVALVFLYLYIAAVVKALLLF